MKIMLGTAQFGRDYGIANKTGKMPYSEVLKVMKLAADSADNGTVYIDTAMDYDNAKIIGRATKDLGIDVRISTKLNREFDKEWPDGIINGVECYLEQIRPNKIDTLMIHDPSWFFGNHADYVYGMLMVLKGKGYTNKIGVSVGDPWHASEILEKYKLDVVQLPFNLLDHRFLDINSRTRAFDSVEIHVRSIFLQGLLLMDPEKLPEYFDPAKPALRELNDYAKAKGVSMLKLCVDFAACSSFQHIIVGVDNSAQLWDVIDAYHSASAGAWPGKSLVNNDSKFINPGLWPVGGWWK